MLVALAAAGGLLGLARPTWSEPARFGVFLLDVSGGSYYVGILIKIVLRDASSKRQVSFRVFPAGDYDEAKLVESMTGGLDNIILKYQVHAPGQGLASMVQHEATVFVGYRADGAECPYVGTLSGQAPGFNPAFITRVGVQITDQDLRGVKPTWDFARSYGLDPQGSEVVDALTIALDESALSFYNGKKYVKALKRLYQIGIIENEASLLSGIIGTGVLEGDINQVNTIVDRGGTILALLAEPGLTPEDILKRSEEFLAKAVDELDAMAPSADERGLIEQASKLLRDRHSDAEKGTSLAAALSVLKEWIAITSSKQGKAFLDDYFFKIQRQKKPASTGPALESLNGLRGVLRLEDAE